MSLFRPLTREQIRADFTHVGWFAFCPVYLSEDGVDGMNCCERNGVPAWVFHAAEAVMALVIFLISAVDHDHEPQFAFIVTGEIERE